MIWTIIGFSLFGIFSGVALILESNLIAIFALISLAALPLISGLDKGYGKKLKKLLK